LWGGVNIRLISIVSNPIKVLVVVVVFVKEKNRSKNFDPITIHVQKSIGSKKI